MRPKKSVILQHIDRIDHEDWSILLSYEGEETMKNKRILSTLLLLIAAFLLAACDANESDTPQDSGVDEQGNPINGDQNDNSGSAGGGGFSGRGIDDWLQRINNDQLPLRNDGDALEWGLGYFLYYLDIDSGALDNLVYNALVVHRQIDTGEISRDSLTQNQQNLLDCILNWLNKDVRLN
jgi:hypothetical protein